MVEAHEALDLFFKNTWLAQRRPRTSPHFGTAPTTSTVMTVNQTMVTSSAPALNNINEDYNNTIALSNLRQQQQQQSDMSLGGTVTTSVSPGYCLSKVNY